MACAAQFLPRVVLRWLAEGRAAAAAAAGADAAAADAAAARCSVRALEQHLYSNWLVSALGGPRQAEMMEEGARAELARFPESHRLETGLVMTALPGGTSLLG